MEGRTVKIGTSLTPKNEERLVKVLKQNASEFAWHSSDMPGIDPDFLCHRLAIDPNAKVVIQKRRKFGEEKRRAIAEETKKLVQAGHVREIQYSTWLANVVMVRKSNGKWRMCTDFIDLNKACPKDSYPLPNIDCLVDGASGYELLSFMDAYSGYNQIRMHSADKDKTPFIANQANFCYRVMLFGLKNAGATYQRLMDKVLVNQLGRNVEPYVDDMVVKSASADRHFDDLQELFDTIGKYQLKLNPEKCSFGVQAGKFLGFLLTHRGIEANPHKCSAIINMRSPSTVKEVQQLAGRIASLSRFLSREADKVLPLFQCLKKNDHFTWTTECEEAFSELKRSLASSPILTKPRPNLPLLVYISMSDRAVNSVLVQEQEASQVPIYFVSRVLQGGETRYQKIEKLALAILVTARKLRHYFQSYEDYFSKWIKAEPVATILAERVRTFLWKNVICRYGVPQVLVSDNGTQFASGRVRDFCREIGIQMTFTSVEHPQSNGQAESANKVILSGLKKRVQDSGASWVEELPRVIWSYHTTVHSSTQDTPFNLVYGTDAMILIEITEPSVRATCFSKEESDQGRRVDLDLIRETRERARINQVAAQRRAAFKYNTKVVPRDFVVGDLVLKRAQLTQMRNKLSPKWVGPYKIDDVVGKEAYRLRTLDGGKIPRTWNAANLRFYYS
uniref:Retrovirus-related Pol polyprotein from transposon 17.6 n=1 Tax=Cajanus cajan TaxID=3821 RepID=A0A151RFS4_CAJCA|nr:Retrovirus-related Pol polyprotein from transposon 17.6 [Cajanus cajan]